MEIQSNTNRLYKRDTKGKVRVWWGETGTDGTIWAWRANSGILDGKIVTSAWKEVEQKNVGRANETSLEQQANFEMNADFDKKSERGYFANQTDIDTFEKFKPMLATGYDEHKFDFETNVYATQPKLDGIRCIARADGLWTRAGKEIVSCPHIFDALKPIFEATPDTILDGELYNHELKEDFNKITSLVRKTKPTDRDIEECADMVEYHIYDTYRIGESFSERSEYISKLPILPKIEYVRTDFIKDNHADVINQLYADYLEAGYEGQMVRNAEMPYELKRSKGLIKRKEFLTDEFKVIGVEEGKGNWAGYIKRFVLELPDGRTFGAGVRGTQKVMQELFESGAKPEWCTLRYFTPTPDGVPRFPVVVDWGMGLRED
jgi:DNA ligase-1